MHALIFTCMLVYDEIVLRFLTTGGEWMPWIVFAGFFSLGYGALAAFLTSLLPPKAGKAVRLILVIITSVLFLVNYFVYRQFKVFYDLVTMVVGAADALGQFQGNVWQMILSFQGIAAILLYTLPPLAYAAYISVFDQNQKSKISQKTVIAVVTAVSLACTILGIRQNANYAPVYTTEYNYQNAITNFGLMTAMRLDTLKHALPSESADFEPSETEEPETPPEPTPTPEIVYPKNVMNIDFNAKAAAGGKLAKLDNYCASQTPSSQNEYTGMFKGKNLILMTCEAFTLEVIDPVLTPTLYRLLTKGIRFTDYYQPASAGTTGGEYEVVFGTMPTAGGNSFKNMAGKNNYMTMGSQLNRLGYNGWAFHNNSYTFYSRHKTHKCLGYSNGFMAYGNGMEKYIKKTWPESDLEMLQATFPMYADSIPFNVYYMTVSGHNGYSRGSNAMTKKNWDRVADLPYSDIVKGYIACNLELEDAMTYLITSLEEKGIANDTVIVMSADHFPYGLDDQGGNLQNLSELYGFQVSNLLERDHNALIMWSGCLEDEEPIVVDTPVSSIDILPTLSNLFGTEYDSRLFIGRDVFSDQQPLVFNMNYDWKTDLGTYVNGKFTANENAEVPEGYVDSIKALVRNKITFCEMYNQTDFFGHLFGQ